MSRLVVRVHYYPLGFLGLARTQFLGLKKNKAELKTADGFK